MQWYNARLMSRDYPDWLNPFKAAQARREFAGTIRLDQLPGVSDLVKDRGEMELGFELAFGLDDQRQACVRVRVHGDVPLTCQRTLRAYRQAIASQSLVGIVESEAAAEALPEDYEPLVVAEPRLRVADLVTEELLLALPLVPRSPDSDPVESQEVAANQGKDDTHRPFAVLAELTGKSDKN